MAKKSRRMTLGAGTLPLDFMLPHSDWVRLDTLPDLRGHGSMIAIDLETRDDGLSNKRGAGWAYGAGHVAGVVISSGEQSVYAPIRHPDSNNFEWDQVRRWLEDHMKSDQYKVFHNAPYDLGWCLSEFGIAMPELLHDTMGMAFILDENRLMYNLDATCAWQGIQGKDEELLRQAADAFGVDPKSEMWKMPAKFVGVYAEQDGTATLELAKKLIPQLESQDVYNAYRLEMDILPMCVEMRRRGVRIDMDEAPRTQERMFGIRDDYLRQMKDIVQIGRDIDIKDISSPQFLSRVFTDLSIPYPKTAKGNDSFSNEWMSKSAHVLPRLIASANQMHDAANKFIGQYIMGYAHMGRLHSEIHQFKDDRGGTVTTRFSYSDPPLQQMPSRNPSIAKFIRGLFLPEKGEVWGALDYSQQEFRLMVHFAKLCKMDGVDFAVDKYREDPNADFHDLAAEMTKLPRSKAKDVNFAKAFGAGKNKFAEMTGMTVEEAEATMAQYDEELPFISRLNEFCQKRADAKGFIRMLDGARGRFDKWEPRWVEYKKIKEANDRAMASGSPLPRTHPCSLEEARERIRDKDHPWFGGRLKRAMTHKAMNKLIQGSAARQTKMAMRECYRQGIIPLLQMHDELDFSFAEKGPAMMAQQIMQEIAPLVVPSKVDAEFGVNWGGAAAEKDDNKMVTYDASWESALARLEAAS